MKKVLPIANGIALIATISVNYFSNTGMLNGNTMKTMSDKYFNYFTPAGYAFSIWGLIYLGLLGFVFYSAGSLFKKGKDNLKQGPLDDLLGKIGWWFVLSCVANSFWVMAWLYDYTGLSVLLMILILVSLGKIVSNTRMELDAHPFKTYLFVFWPFTIYFGWISLALIANIAAYLTKINWNGWGISELNWTIIMIVVAGFVNILMIRLRNMREFGAVGIWALLAISVSNANNNASTSIIYTCYVVAGIVLIFLLLSAIKNRHRSFENM